MGSAVHGEAAKHEKKLTFYANTLAARGLEEPCVSFPDFCNNRQFPVTTSPVTTEKFLPRRLPR